MHSVISKKALTPTLSLAIAIATESVAIGDGWESESEISTALGYDSNPFQLNDGYDNAFFTEIEAEQTFTHTVGKEAAIELSLDGRGLFYESDASDSNRWNINPSLKLISGEYDWSGGELDSDIEVSAVYRDSTFTSRRTGEEAASRGTLVGDRYDSWTYDAIFGLRYRKDRKWYLYWDNGYRYKNYTEDYAALGLDRLDYHEFESDFRIRYRATDKFTLSGDLELHHRSYVDRRIKDLSGDRIAGSDLEYDSIMVGAQIAYEINDLWQISVGISHDQRSDNGDGYSDKTTEDYYVEIEYEKGPLEAAFEAEYVDRSFDNGEIDADGIDEPERSKEAWQFSFDIEYSLDLFESAESTLFAQIENELVDNTSETLTYDRTVALVGIVFEF
ncbi:MAG: transporter [Opitutales bacterium]